MKQAGFAWSAIMRLLLMIQVGGLPPVYPHILASLGVARLSNTAKLKCT